MDGMHILQLGHDPASLVGDPDSPADVRLAAMLLSQWHAGVTEFLREGRDKTGETLFSGLSAALALAATQVVLNLTAQSGARNEVAGHLLDNIRHQVETLLEMRALGEQVLGWSEMDDPDERPD